LSEHQVTQQPPADSTAEYPYRHVMTNDGVRISYFDIGDGPCVVLLHGLGQTAAQFTKQVTRFSRDHRLIGIDLRGHGESAKPDHGYRIARLAADVKAVLASESLRDFTMLGHSMGCSVIWSYIDQFGLAGIRALVLVDQPPALVIQPTWTDDEAAEYGAILTPHQVYTTARRLLDHRVYASTPFMSEQDRDFFAARHALFPAKHEATLLIDHAFQDWRDVLPRIDVPTLVIGGDELASAAGWTASRIAGATLRIFTWADRGSHFMFWDNPDEFNGELARFLPC
jgi:pimeloyl-ACP methyl ester carboxylesterase